MKLITKFDERISPSIAEVRGKALSLIEMTKAGLPVPTGFVLSVSFFEPWHERLEKTKEWKRVQADLSGESNLEKSTADLKAVARATKFIKSQRKALKEAVESLPQGAIYAVRSSSPEEDLAGASFAGGYETTLGVTKDTLEEAILASFASAFDERVFVYKQQQGFAGDKPRIAVVIQQQIASDCAGVGFSLNPLNNDFDEAVIDASWGQGESVVSGAVSPGHFVVNKIEWQIKEQRLGEKKTAIWLKDDGGVETCEESRSAEFCITGKQALEIVDVTKSVEQLFQKPVDIEWAYGQGELYLLQGRPITAYVPLDHSMLTEPDEQRILYYDVSLTEGLTINQAMSPLSMDCFLGVMDMIHSQLMGSIPTDPYGDLTERLFIVAGGRIYMNLSQLMTVMSPEVLAQEVGMADILLAKLFRIVDRRKYTAKKKVSTLRWTKLLPAMGRALFGAWPMLKSTLSAFWNPKKFYEHYAKVVSPLIEQLRLPFDESLSLAEAIRSDNSLLGPVIGELSFPSVIA